MKDTELKELRDSALYKAYKSANREHHFSSIREACEYLAHNATAPQFYIEASTASILFGRLAKGDTLDELHESSRRRIFQLVENYHKYRKEHPYSDLTRLDVLVIICNQPAPEFYLGVERIRAIITRQLKAERVRR